MTKKQYDLKTILSNRAYRAVANYSAPALSNGAPNPNYGLDAMALIGKIAYDEKYQTTSLDDVVESFHNLADPTFINLADEWGATYQAKNKIADNLGAYADGKFNSFSLKGQPSNLSYLSFPLRGNRMSADKNFTNHPFPFGWETMKNGLEKTLNIKIAEGSSLQDAPNNMFEKLLSPAVRVKGTNSVLLSQTFNGAKLSEAEKFLAVVDVINHENAKKLLSEDKALAQEFKNLDAATARQILYAGQITADMFSALAANLGAENHKQIENALRLELCGVLANLADKSFVNTKLYACVATKMAASILNQLQFDCKSIVAHRAAMGITYVDDLYPNSKDFITEQPNLKVVMFGRTINNAFKLENNQVKFIGNSAAFDALQPNAQFVKTQDEIGQALSGDSLFVAHSQNVQEEDIVWIPEAQPDGSLPTEIDWIPEDPEPEDAPEVEINQFDILKIKALEDHYDLPLPAATEPTAENAQEAILLPPVQEAKPKMRSLADLVAETRVARRDAEMFAKPAAKTTTQTKLFGDDYAPTVVKPLEQNPQVETQQTTLSEYEEKAYLDLRPLVENMPVVERSILNADMKDFDLSKTPIFEAQTTEKTTEESAKEITTTQHTKSIKVARKNTVRNLIGYGKSPLADVKANIEAQKLANAPKYKISLPETFKNALKQNDFSSMQMQHMMGVLYKGLEKKEIFVGPKTPNATKKFAYYALSEEVAKKYNKKLSNIFWYFEGDNVIAKKRAKKLKFAVDFADYLAEENQVALNAKKLAYVANHKEYLENEEKNARIARVRAKMKEWQENNAKKKIAAAVATANALKAQVETTEEIANETENTPAKISKRKTTSNPRLKNSGKVLHVWKDGHYDYV